MNAPATSQQTGVGPAQDHGKASLISLGVTLVTFALSGGMVAAVGMPRTTTEPVFIVVATLLGFGFVGGQAAMVTGFLAMKQRQNPLWVLPALLGLFLGIAGFVLIFGLSLYLGAIKAGVRF